VYYIFFRSPIINNYVIYLRPEVRIKFIKMSHTLHQHFHEDFQHVANIRLTEKNDKVSSYTYVKKKYNSTNFQIEKKMQGM